MGVARVGVGRADADDIVLYFLRMLTRLWILDWASRGALYNNIDLISMDLHRRDAGPPKANYDPRYGFRTIWVKIGWNLDTDSAPRWPKGGGRLDIFPHLGVAARRGSICFRTMGAGCTWAGGGIKTPAWRMEDNRRPVGEFDPKSYSEALL